MLLVGFPGSSWIHGKAPKSCSNCTHRRDSRSMCIPSIDGIGRNLKYRASICPREYFAGGLFGRLPSSEGQRHLADNESMRLRPGGGTSWKLVLPRDRSPAEVAETYGAELAGRKAEQAGSLSYIGTPSFQFDNPYMYNNQQRGGCPRRARL
jgi:hypothetical protein